MNVRIAWLATLVAIGICTPATSAQPDTRSAKAPAAGTDAAQPVQEITARSWVDRTAIWVGDRVVLTVEIECAPTVDILSADLASEKLGLTGLEVVDASSERILAESGRLTYRYRYWLTTYQTGLAPLGIGDLTVRYGRRRAGQRLEEAAPAGELKVAGATLALRSTIPDDVESVNARDRRPLEAIPGILRLAGPVGLGLILISAAPVIVWAVALIRRRRPRTRRKDTRAARSQTRAALEQLEPADLSSAEARREAYTRLDAVVREHLSNVTGLAAVALTPPEIAQRLTATGSSLPVESVSAVLEECERARYGPPGLLPPADRFREAVSSAERILAVTR